MRMMQRHRYTPINDNSRHYSAVIVARIFMNRGTATETLKKRDTTQWGEGFVERNPIKSKYRTVVSFILVPTVVHEILYCILYIERKK